MKVIKRGEKKPVVFTATCKACGSEIEAKESELNVRWCPRERFSFAHERCPVCECGIIFYKQPTN